MPVLQLAAMTWEEVASLEEGAIAILPTGAVEAHGPHLPLATDEIIAVAMAQDAARRLATGGTSVVLLPPLVYTAASFAAEFPGTVSIRPETVTEVLVDIGGSIARAGIARLAIANAHLDPAHLASLHSATERLRRTGLVVAFPDLTRKAWASRLTDEFKSGACHAGRFEGSVVMEAQPGAVREHIQRELPPNPSSLSVAIGAGLDSFESAGGPRAYFGDPAAASAEEGRSTIAALGKIMVDAVAAQSDP